MVFRFVETLQEVIESFSGQLSAFSTTLSSPSPPSTASVHQKDFKHILGHQQVKKALEIAAAGGHNVMMTGPPGCGKSLLAETFPSILLYLSHEHQFEVVSIYQLAVVEKPHLGLPPFRHPHHSASAVSLDWRRFKSETRRSETGSLIVLKYSSPTKKPPDEKTLYRVQVGAISNKTNAEALLKKVKTAGFDGYVKFE
ncbi:ATP-binding protein [Bacillaceae bacterium S4-13-58]